MGSLRATLRAATLANRFLRYIVTVILTGYAKANLGKEIITFLKVRKKYWLAPLIITIVLMGALIVFTQGSVMAPFTYTLF